MLPSHKHYYEFIFFIFWYRTLIWSSVSCCCFLILSWFWSLISCWSYVPCRCCFFSLSLSFKSYFHVLFFFVVFLTNLTFHYLPSAIKLCDKLHVSYLFVEVAKLFFCLLVLLSGRTSFSSFCHCIFSNPMLFSPCCCCCCFSFVNNSLVAFFLFFCLWICWLVTILYVFACRLYASDKKLLSFVLLLFTPIHILYDYLSDVWS